MVNKRGYIRILESLIAVIMILSFFLYISQRNVNYNTGVPSVVSESQKFILDEIAINDNYVDSVLNYNYGASKQGACKSNGYTSQVSGSSFQCGGDDGEFATLIDANVPQGYESACEICEQSLSCLGGNDDIPRSDESVYTSTTFLVGDGTNEKVVRLYFWRKGL